MDALDAEEGFEPDEPEPEPSSFDGQPSDGLFAVDDDHLSRLLGEVSNQGFVGGTWHQTPQVCALQVPKYFLIRHSLTI